MRKNKDKIYLVFTIDPLIQVNTVVTGITARKKRIDSHKKMHAKIPIYYHEIKEG